MSVHQCIYQCIVHHFSHTLELIRYAKFKSFFDISSLMRPVDLIQCAIAFPTGLIILTFWHLINVLSNWKFVPQLLPNLFSICNFSRKILYLSMIGVYDHYIWLCLTLCVKSVRIRSYSGSHFPAFGLNTGNYESE